jgi:hypothetical protein
MIVSDVTVGQRTVSDVTAPEGGLLTAARVESRASPVC